VVDDRARWWANDPELIEIRRGTSKRYGRPLPPGPRGAISPGRSNVPKQLHGPRTGGSARYHLVGSHQPSSRTAKPVGSHPWEQTRWCMANKGRGQRLRGRAGECATLRGLLSSVQSGSSRVLVLRGEAGVGKTALLEYVALQASGFRFARVTGVQSDMELAFAGLHQLCAPLLNHLDELPDPQCEALAVAFGRGVGVTPDRFLVGLAVLSLMAIAADDQPLLCVIDDAQWLDQVSVQTLAFVARRLMAEPVALVFAVRDGGPADVLAGLPELVVDGLSDGAARELLDSVLLGRLDERVRDRIIAETRGNPLALLELPRNLSAAELAGGFGNLGSRPLAGQIEQSFVRRSSPFHLRPNDWCLSQQPNRWETRRCLYARRRSSASKSMHWRRPKPRE
jgi:hypothetical protein